MAAGGACNHRPPGAACYLVITPWYLVIAPCYLVRSPRSLVITPCDLVSTPRSLVITPQVRRFYALHGMAVGQVVARH